MNTNNESQQDNTIDGQVTLVESDKAMATLDPAKYAAVAFEPFKAKLAAAKRAAKKAEYNIATKEGMKQAKELRASFRDIRTGIESARKEAKGPILEAGKKVDAVAKELTDEVAPHEDKYAAEIAAEEARIEEEKQRKLAEERARIEAIESRIAHIRGLAASLAQASAETLAAKVEELATKRLDPAMYDEHLEDAVNALNKAVDDLRALHQQALAREEEQKRIAAERAELERLRAEREEAERAAREVAAERERAAQAERDKAAAEKADLERQIAEMRAQLAAAQPQPAAAPIEPAAPVVADVEQDGTGIVVGTIEVSDTTPASAPLDIVDAPMPYASAVAVNDPMRVEPVPHVPNDFELIDLVANTYNESRRTALDWLAAINFARAYDNLAEQA